MQKKSPSNTAAMVLSVIIAYGIVWLLVGISTWFRVPFTPSLIIGSWAPNIAAFLVIGVVLREKHGIRDLLARWLKWRFGAVWAAFHLPLWTIPGGPWASIPFWSFGLAAVSASVIFGWLVNGAGGSAVIATIFHFLFNVASNLVVMLGVPVPSFYAIYALLFTAFAVVVAIAREMSRAGGGAGRPARAL